MSPLSQDRECLTPWEHYKLSLCYKALGKAELAREHFAKAVQSPAPKDSPWRAKAQKELSVFEEPQIGGEGP